MGDDALEPSLSERVRTLEERLADVARLAEIVMSAPGDPRIPPPRPRRPRRPHPHLRVVKGLAVPVAAAGHWLMRSHAHRALAAALIAATAAGSALSPEMMPNAGAGQVPRAHHHHHAVMPRRRQSASGVPVVAGTRKRRRSDNDGTVRPRASASPSAAPSPTVTPIPVPSPLPSVPPPPVPTPVPTCTPLHGKHCHDEVVVAERALWRLAA